MDVHKFRFKLFIVIGTFFFTMVTIIYYTSRLEKGPDLLLTSPALKEKEPIRRYLLVEIAKEKLNIGLPVVTNVPGGIGNQLFEFACAYTIARKRNSNVYVRKPDYSLNGNHIHSVTGRDFSLDHFNITFSGSVQEDFTSFGSGEIFDFKEHHIWEHLLPEDKVLRLNDVCFGSVL